MKKFNEWLKEKEIITEAKKAKKKEDHKEKDHKEKSKGKDVTGDGKKDFADVLASRMIASGMSKEEAIKKAHHHADKHKKKKNKL